MSLPWHPVIYNIQFFYSFASYYPEPLKPTEISSSFKVRLFTETRNTEGGTFSVLKDFKILFLRFPWHALFKNFISKITWGCGDPARVFESTHLSILESSKKPTIPLGGQRCQNGQFSMVLHG